MKQDVGVGVNRRIDPGWNITEAVIVQRMRIERGQANMPERELASRNLTKVTVALSLEHPVGGSAPHELFLTAERRQSFGSGNSSRDDARPVITIIVEGED